MRVVACQQGNLLQAITARPPLGVDLVAEKGSPFFVTFNLFDDPEATNLRGLWQPWSVYEESEAAYMTPEGPESGISAQHTPTTFGLWRSKQRTQHSEPGKPESKLFWTPMAEWNLTGYNVVFSFPGRSSLNAVGTISGGSVGVQLFAAQTESAPSSLRYILQLMSGTNVVTNLSRGQLIFRSGEAGPPGTESSGTSGAGFGQSPYGEGAY